MNERQISQGAVADNGGAVLCKRLHCSVRHVPAGMVTWRPFRRASSTINPPGKPATKPVARPFKCRCFCSLAGSAGGKTVEGLTAPSVPPIIRCNRCPDRRCDSKRQSGRPGFEIFFARWLDHAGFCLMRRSAQFLALPLLKPVLMGQSAIFIGRPRGGTISLQARRKPPPARNQRRPDTSACSKRRGGAAPITARPLNDALPGANLLLCERQTLFASCAYAQQKVRLARHMLGCGLLVGY